MEEYTCLNSPFAMFEHVDDVLFLLIEKHKRKSFFLFAPVDINESRWLSE